MSIFLDDIKMLIARILLQTTKICCCPMNILLPVDKHTNLRGSENFKRKLMRNLALDLSPMREDIHTLVPCVAI